MLAPKFPLHWSVSQVTAICTWSTVEKMRKGGREKATDKSLLLRTTASEVHIFFCRSHIIKGLLASVIVSVTAEQFLVLKTWYLQLSSRPLLTSRMKVSLWWRKFMLLCWWSCLGSTWAAASCGSSPMRLQGWLECALPTWCPFLSVAVVIWWEDIMICDLYPQDFLLVQPLLLKFIFFSICGGREPVPMVSEYCNESSNWASSTWCWQSGYRAISTFFLSP